MLLSTGGGEGRERTGRALDSCQSGQPNLPTLPSTCLPTNLAGLVNGVRLTVLLPKPLSALPCRAPFLSIVGRGIAAHSPHPAAPKIGVHAAVMNRGYLGTLEVLRSTPFEYMYSVFHHNLDIVRTCLGTYLGTQYYGPFLHTLWHANQ